MRHFFVAHPDDETIWMGGTILSRCEWNWKIFVSSYKIDDQRGREFQKAIELYRIYNKKYLDFEFIGVFDDTIKEENIDIGAVNQLINNKLECFKLSEFDVIFTHNIDGEYNKIHHKILGNYFKNFRRDGLNIWHFLCPAIQNPREKKIGGYVESVFLNEAVISNKLFVFQCAYNSQQYYWTGFSDFMRFQFCSGLEMFTRY
jgi:hypothetical protein